MTRSAARRAGVLHDGRELPAPQAPRAGAARVHAARREGVVAVRLLVRERDPPVQHAAARRARRRMDLARARIAEDDVRQARRRRHAGAHRASSRRTASACSGSTIVGMEHHTPENIWQEIDHAIAHDTDLPPVHALHADARHAALSTGRGRGPPARRRGPRRHPRPARVQLPAPGDLAGAVEGAPRRARSGPITSGTVRASTG